MAKSKDVITQIKKATRRKFSADEKIRIVLEGLRGQSSISEVCRRWLIKIAINRLITLLYLQEIHLGLHFGIKLLRLCFLVLSTETRVTLS